MTLIATFIQDYLPDLECRNFCEFLISCCFHILTFHLYSNKSSQQSLDVLSDPPKSEQPSNSPKSGKLADSPPLERRDVTDSNIDPDPIYSVVMKGGRERRISQNSDLELTRQNQKEFTRESETGSIRQSETGSIGPSETVYHRQSETVYQIQSEVESIRQMEGCSIRGSETVDRAGDRSSPIIPRQTAGSREHVTSDRRISWHDTPIEVTKL